MTIVSYVTIFFYFFYEIKSLKHDIEFSFFLIVIVITVGVLIPFSTVFVHD